jgi:D-3-phosphoglycerate dehydrogenase
MKIYILDDFEPTGVEFIQSKVQQVIPFGDPATSQWHEDAEAVMIRGSRLTADDFAKAKKLKVVSKQGVGVDNLDLEAARRHGVVVCTTPGVNSDAVAELAFGLALSVSRRIQEMDQMIRAGEKIVRPQLLGYELHQKTVGVIGMGNIGSRTARYFHKAFDCQILAYDPYTKPDAWADLPHERINDLKQLWPVVDLVTLHVPLTETTYHIVNREAIALMKPSGMVINVSRGGLIDEVALYEALSQGRLFGAGLDAFEEGEPPSANNPLLSLRNVVATPHAGAGTVETQIKSSLLTAQQLWHVLQGNEPFHRVA